MIRTPNQDLNSLTFENILKRLLGILKRHLAAHQALNLKRTPGHQLDSQLVVSASVTEASPHRDLLGAHCHDREGNIWLPHPTLHVHTAAAHNVDASLDTRLGAAGINDYISALAKVRGFNEVLGVYLRGDTLRHERVRRCVALCKIETTLLDIHADDFCGAESLRDGAAEEANGAGAHDDDGGAGGDLGLLGDVDGDGEGLNQRAFLESDLLGELVAEVLGGGVEAAESSVVGRGGGEAHVGAEVVVAAQARFAVAAGGSGLDGDAVAELEGGDSGADLGDCAGGFVTEAHGGFEDEGANGAMLPVVHIGSADAGEGDGDEDGAGVSEGGDWALLIGDGERRVQDEGEVLGGVRSGVGGRPPGPGGDWRRTLFPSVRETILTAFMVVFGVCFGVLVVIARDSMQFYAIAMAVCVVPFQMS